MRRDLSSLVLAAPVSVSRVPLSRSSWENAVSNARESRGTSVPHRGTCVPDPLTSDPPARRLVAFLRRRHPIKTAIAVEAEAGVSEAAIKKLMARGTMPSFLTLGRLLAAYGPELLAATMDNPPEWLRSAAAIQASRKDGGET
jgi:hypothetical protein